MQESAHAKVAELLKNISVRGVEGLVHSVQRSGNEQCVALAMRTQEQPVVQLRTIAEAHVSSNCSGVGPYLPDCRDVIATGLPVTRERTLASPGAQNARPMVAHTLLCPVDGPDSSVVGVLIITRLRPFTSEEVDFYRLLGLHLASTLEVSHEQPGARQTGIRKNG